MATDTPSPLSAAVTTVPHAATPTGIDLKQRLLPLDVIEPNPDQPRRLFDENGELLDPRTMQELVQSIQRVGVLQPILVRSLPNDRFSIVAGERRWRAAQLAGLTHIPVAITNSDDPDLLALLENIQREDLSALDLASYLHRLKEERGISQDKLAELIGKSKTYVSRMLAILTLPGEILEELPSHRDKISAKMLTEIVEAGEKDIQLALWDKVKQGASANTIRLIKRLPQDILAELPHYRNRITVSHLIALLEEEDEEQQLALWQQIKEDAAIAFQDKAAPRPKREGENARFFAQIVRLTKNARKLHHSVAEMTDEQIAEIEEARAALDDILAQAKLRRRN
ncbi:ParB/RepB/Spo0J family partition protein [Telmatospirillum sp. J64-1]|uniref:ParB/RepB/Spo0J family partition protein n=1 Tax=Telmatospirillum sp. J64-1 TaxID=2502183 RepID=UPI001C8F8AB3|nr:ParB/RepB/Spo0J family partition protein [Telmatospirillum sp. J64-1]